MAEWPCYNKIQYWFSIKFLLNSATSLQPSNVGHLEVNDLHHQNMKRRKKQLSSPVHEIINILKSHGFKAKVLDKLERDTNKEEEVAERFRKSH